MAGSEGRQRSAASGQREESRRGGGTHHDGGLGLPEVVDDRDPHEERVVGAPRDQGAQPEQQVQAAVAAGVPERDERASDHEEFPDDEGGLVEPDLLGGAEGLPWDVLPPAAEHRNACTAAARQSVAGLAAVSRRPCSHWPSGFGLRRGPWFDYNKCTNYGFIIYTQVRMTKLLVMYRYSRGLRAKIPYIPIEGVPFLQFTMEDSRPLYKLPLHYW